jgi:hypothetical protein
MATNGALVGFDAVRPHATAYSAHRTVGSARPRSNAKRGPDQNGGFIERLRARVRASMTFWNDPCVTGREASVLSSPDDPRDSLLSRARENR